MTVWLYAASRALASEGDTVSLACESGFIWRLFSNVKGNPINAHAMRCTTRPTPWQPGRPSNPRRLPLPNKFLLTTITYCNMIIAYCDMAIHTARAIVIEAAKAPRFRPGAELPRGGTRTQKEYTPNL